MRHIYIIDDIEDNLDVLGDLLSEEKTKISKFVRGKEALISIEKDNPDLILLDLFMPEMDGFDATKLIKANPDFIDIPIIALTAYATKDHVEKFSSVFNDYITKPISEEELIYYVKKYLVEEY